MTTAEQLSKWASEGHIPPSLADKAAAELDQRDDTIAQLRAERDALARERETLVERLARELIENGKLRQLLRRCEWQKYANYCPICDRIEADGHASDCGLQAALKGEAK